MTDRIGWGILATGLIADLFTRDLQAAGLRVAAVGSRDASRAAEFAGRFGIPAAHGSLEELVTDPTVDIVYVATPHPFHVQGALAAVEAGKHVLVEKAFTLNADEAGRVIEAGERAGRLVLEAMWTRFLPHMVEIRALLADGAIGEPAALVADHMQSLPSDPAHRLNAPGLGGGALLDLGVYPVSFAVDLFGEPTEVQAVSTPASTGVDRRISGVLLHGAGQHTAFTAASDLPGPNHASVVGTTGSIEIDPVWYAPTAYTVLDADRRVVRRSRPAVSGRGMQYQALEAERLIREGALGSRLMSPEGSLAVMRTLDALRGRIGLTYPQESGSAAG